MHTKNCFSPIPYFREEAVAKANALLERNVKERKQYTLEMSELSRLIRHEEKLLEFMNTKNKERAFLETDDERLSQFYFETTVRVTPFY